jgi:hypothetical protein
VLGVGRAVAPFQRDEEEDLGDRVGDRVRRLGQHRRGVADQAADELRDGDREVREPGDDDRAGRLTAAVGPVSLLREGVLRRRGRLRHVLPGAR